MFSCTNCQGVLARVKSEQGIFWDCPSCSGRLASISLLRKVTTQDVTNQIWRRAKDGPFQEGRGCPCCDFDMNQVRPEGDPPYPWLDVCTRCHMVWFDPDEFDVLPGLPDAPSPDETPPEIRQAAAIMEVHLEYEHRDERAAGDSFPEETWHWLPGLLGFPVEEGSPELARAPLITWGLALVTLVASVLAMVMGLDEAVARFGLIPSEIGRLGGATPFTSFLLHVGVLHLLSNLWFLLVFGDNVEDYLGRSTFLLLIAGATLFGDVLHVMANPQSDVAVIGASGGISGIIAFYALKFPHVRIRFLFYYVRWFQMPAYAAFVLWLGLQGLGAMLQMVGLSGVSFLAHLGGAAVGFVFWWLFRNK